MKTRSMRCPTLLTTRFHRRSTFDLAGTGGVMSALTISKSTVVGEAHVPTLHLCSDAFGLCVLVLLLLLALVPPLTALVCGELKPRGVGRAPGVLDWKPESHSSAVAVGSTKPDTVSAFALPLEQWVALWMWA